jgi:glycosyltransferase involved in cell wall biosynthesis
MTQPVCKSYQLTLSNKVFEYMVAGIPIVASTVDGHRRLMEETEALELADPFSPQDIAKVLNQLLMSPEKMHQMGISARKWAEQKYNVTKEMEKLRLSYDIISGHRPAIC